MFDSLLGEAMKKIASKKLLKVSALGALVSVTGIAAAPAIAAPASSSKSQTTVTKLSNGKYKVSLNFASSLKGKLVAIKTKTVVNGKSVTVNLGTVRLNASGNGSLTVSKKISVGNNLIVSSGAQTLYSKAISTIASGTTAPVIPPVLSIPGLANGGGLPVLFQYDISNTGLSAFNSASTAYSAALSAVSVKSTAATSAFALAGVSAANAALTSTSTASSTAAITRESANTAKSAATSTYLVASAAAASAASALTSAEAADSTNTNASTSAALSSATAARISTSTAEATASTAASTATSTYTSASTAASTAASAATSTSTSAAANSNYSTWVLKTNEYTSASTAVVTESTAVSSTRAAVAFSTANVAAPYVISNFDVREDVNVTGLTAFVKLSSSDAGTVMSKVSLDEALTYAAGLAEDFVVFAYDGNTYVYGDFGTAGTKDSTDLLVKINGLVDLDVLLTKLQSN